MCRFPKALGGVEELAEIGEEAVDTLTESQRELSGGREEEEVVDVKLDLSSSPTRVPEETLGRHVAVGVRRPPVVCRKPTGVGLA
jgi:hypothetical protein